MAGGLRSGMWWLAALYSALAIVAAGYALYQGNVVRANSEFSGLPLMLLALPWSWWFRDFNPRLVQSTFNNSVLVMTGFVAVNAIVLIVVGQLLGRSKTSSPFRLRNRCQDLLAEPMHHLVRAARRRRAG